MEISATTTIDVNIDAEKQKEITEKFLIELFDMPADGFIDKKTGNLVFWWEESMGSHSSTEKEVVRKATKSDVLYFKMLDEIQEKWEKLTDSQKESF